MSPETHSKLIKILMLTTSENDGEALSAARMANSILKNEGLVWSQVEIRAYIERPKKVPTYSKPSEPKNDEPDLDDIFDYVLTETPDWFDSTFVEDLYEKWESGRTLTVKQRESLLKVYNMLKKKE